MDPENNAKIKFLFGEKVCQYLEKNNEKLRKTESNAFAISKFEHLQKCVWLSPTSDQRVLSQAAAKGKRKKGQRSRKRAQQSWEKSGGKRLQQDLEARKSSEESKLSKLGLSVVQNLEVCAHDCSKEFKATCLENFLNRTWNLELIAQRISPETVGKGPGNFPPECHDLRRQLVEWGRRHARFKYKIVLETIMDADCKKKVAKHRLVQISHSQLLQFFRIIFLGVVPRRFFGTNYNLKKLLKGFKQMILASWNEKVSLKSFVCGMDISSIDWLKSVGKEADKWALLGRVVKWTFDHFVCAILHTVVRIEKDVYTEEQVFLHALRWSNERNRYIQLLKNRKTLSTPGNSGSTPATETPPLAYLNLHKKSHGIRPIHYIRYEKKDSVQIKFMIEFLQQMYLSKYKYDTIEKLHEALLSYPDRSEKKLHLVSTDISDAFGSIIQVQLYEIVRKMIAEIPGDSITREWMAILRPNRTNRRQGVERKMWFSSCMKSPPAPGNTLVALVNDNFSRREIFPKKTLEARLRIYIFRQMVLYKGEQYRLDKGVPVGSRLSPILSNIYYNEMRIREFAIFMESGTLTRFADDFFYITDNEESAKGFLGRVTKGVKNYSCRFKISKTKTNLPKTSKTQTHCSPYVPYLGFLIDSKTYRVVPNYKNVTSFRHSKTLQNLPYRNEIRTFHARMQNMSALYLRKIVLDPRINNIPTIFRVASMAGRVMAWRAVILVSKIFDNPESEARHVWSELVNTVSRLTRVIGRALPNYHDGNNRRRLIIKLETTIWRTFRQVFAKNRRINDIFSAAIRQIIHENEHPRSRCFCY